MGKELNPRARKTSADGRYEIDESYPHSEHFMAPDRKWTLIDTVSLDRQR